MNCKLMECAEIIKLDIKIYSLKNGGDKETRTPDPLLAKQMLYQLSYIP